MADNLPQNGTGTVRTEDRAGVQTQIFGLDLNPAGIETLMAGAMPVLPQAVQLTGQSATPAATTISLGSLAAAADLSLPEIASVEIYYINGTNQQMNAQPALTFTGDAQGGQTPSVAYSVFVNATPAGQQAVQRIALTNGFLRNVSVTVGFGTAPTAGAVYVRAVFHGAGKAGTYQVDPTNGTALRVYADAGGFADNNGNLMVMGREYGPGGASAIARAMHVDADGCLLRAPARVLSTVTAASGVAVTATMPAPAAGFWNHVTGIQITKYAAAALTANAAPVVVTTTGLPGPPAFTFGTVGALGSIEEKDCRYDNPIRASAAATAVTVICPATTGVIWRVNLMGYQA